MREPMGKEAGMGGGVTLILSVGEGGTKVNFRLVRGGGVRLNFEPYFAHFPAPPPDNYCTVPYRKLMLHEISANFKTSRCKTPPLSR